ncbi:MAG: bifunctional (p)ppGpp synthetase/guanosine-3',5'-bis(diphosphate) 3'-pyrophosphohydrolase [Pseudomonadota bacterium]
MVQVRHSHPLHESNEVDLNGWIEALPIELNTEQRKRLLSSCECAVQTIKQKPLSPNPYAWSNDYNPFHVGLEMANILADLNLDVDTLIAAILYRLAREKRLSLRHVRKEFGDVVATLLEHMLNMSQIRLVGGQDQRVLGQTESQSETMRKMLVTMLDDVRVVLLKLAERCCALRLSADSKQRSQKLAREAVQIYIPLAHRLGIGQLKWELEDFAFRYLEVDAYKRIAKQLSERRLDRERYLDDVLKAVNDGLKSEGIEGEVNGRVKHIYSIWKKMQRKNISFSEVYDIRAVRVLVPEVRDCYTALGLVHSLWGNISSEFDDYIAQPKANGYRSLHTAVVGPEDKVVEIQIRTFEMHEEAELGVCAHWVYKGVSERRHQESYEEKLNWFRQAVESYETEDALNVFADELNKGLKDNRIYTFTPKGHVVELPKGSTPLDFAYHVHTEVGHGCRGAKVNGRIVPLSYQLQTSDRVEVIVEKGGEPNNEWLRSELGYIYTTRAKLKIRTWFRQQNGQKREQVGRKLLEREIKRLSLNHINLKLLALQLGLNSVSELHANLGAGDIGIKQVLSQAQEMLDLGQEIEADTLPLVNNTPSVLSEALNVDVQGTGNYLSSIAECCKPLPGDVIRGYVTQGRGVSIHRSDCQQFLRLQRKSPERIMDVSLGKQQTGRFVTDVFIEAYDRTGLIRDISTLLANEHVNVRSLQTHTLEKEGLVHMTVCIELRDFEHLSIVLARLSRLSNVMHATRAQQ